MPPPVCRLSFIAFPMDWPFFILWFFLCASCIQKCTILLLLTDKLLIANSKFSSIIKTNKEMLTNSKVGCLGIKDSKNQLTRNQLELNNLIYAYHWVEHAHIPPNWGETRECNRSGIRPYKWMWASEKSSTMVERKRNIDVSR